MTQSSGNQPAWWEHVQKFLDNKVVGWGIPGVFVAIAADHAKNSRWQEFGILIGVAIAAWFVLKLGSRLLPYLDQLLDWILGTVIPRATASFSFESRYLTCQMEDCSLYYTEDFNPTRTPGNRGRNISNPRLEEVFVALEISGDSRTLDCNIASAQWLQLESSDADREKPKPLFIWDFLAQTRKIGAYRQTVILAQGGFGKTTLLRHITYTYAKRRHPRHKAPHLVPVLLYLRRCRDLLALAEPPTLPELITQHHIPRLPEGDSLKQRIPTDWALDLLIKGKALVMLDGFDEVAESQRQAVSEWISAQMRQYPRSVFILTSRPTGYRQGYTAEPPQAELFVQGLQPEQQQKFIKQWYLRQELLTVGFRNTPAVRELAEREAANLIQQIEVRPELRRLAENPLLLNMIVKLHRAYPDSQLPERRIDLYRDICQLQLSIRPRARGIEMLLEPDERQSVLQGVALDMLTREQHPVIDREPLLDLLKEHLDPIDPALDPKQVLKQIVQVSELLVDREQSERYEFSHLSFQSYLAAEQLKQLDNANHAGEALVLQHCDQPSWREPILMYAALVNPTAIIRGLCQRQQPAQIDLAYACWQQSPRRGRVDAELFAELQTSRYRALETYLQNQQWKEADRETYRLMIKTVGKEEGQLFSADELLHFPCDDLKRLDRLWVHYSNGKWGFSVQKAIYVSPEVGGIADGRYDEVAFNKFGDRVGWRKGGKWSNYDNLTLDLQKSPAGEFPFSERIFAVRFLQFVVGSLLSHKDL